MNTLNTMSSRLALRGLVLALASSGTLHAATPAPYALTPNDTSWSYTYVNQAPTSWTDPSFTKLKSPTTGGVEADSIIWSSGDMALDPGIDLALPRRALVDYFMIASYIHNDSYGIPTSSLGARTNSALPYVQIAANSVAETWASASGAKTRNYTASTPTMLGRFDRRNEGSEFLMQFFNQGKRLDLGHVRLFGRWSTYDTTGTGFIGYDYEVLPGDDKSSAWTDDGNDLLTRFQGDYNEGVNPNSSDVGSVIWHATTMATTNVAVVFDMGGGHQVDGVALGSYFHTAAYVVPPLKFEVSRRIDRPEWTEIGTYAGKPNTGLGAQFVTISGFDDAPGRYLRMSSSVVTNVPFDVFSVELSTTPKPLWPLTTVVVVR